MRVRSARWMGTLALLTALTPTAQVGGQDLEQLRARLSNAIAPSTWRGATWGVMVRSLDTGDTLFALEADEPLAPASNLKLLTTAAALRVLGPEYRFRTYLLTNGNVVDGVLEGDLVLYGTGDPGISDRFYRKKEDVFRVLVDQLTQLGIHTVRGDLVGDASFFAGPLRPEGWDPADLNDAFAGAVSALSFNENVVSFRVVAGRAGETPSFYTIPENTGLDVLNAARTVAADARPRIAILRDAPLDPIRIEGNLLTGARDVWREITVPIPARFAASAFRATLEEGGIALLGGLRVVDDADASLLGQPGVTAPALGRRSARILARHVSDPLSVYLAVVNKESNNLFAELVFRALGRAASGVGSSEAGSAAVRTALGELGVDMTDVVQLDGSGLSSGSRVSASTFVEVMETMADGPVWAEYWASLPEAGSRRELGRMFGTPAAGNLRAKTGTIEGVSALSGLVRSRNGERLAFSLMVNGTRSNGRAKAVENQVGALLAGFGRPLIEDPALRFARGLAQVDADEPTRYLVGRGESLAAIADQHGLDVEDLVRANPDMQATRVVPGQWIEIPRRSVTQ